MPLYEYECSDHGVFEVRRSLAESAQPDACPVCDRASPRIVSAPAFRRLARSQVHALDRNERSRYEPKVVHTSAPPSDARPQLRRAGGYPWAIGH
jgi:putative FmdB family regulatory protein